MSFTIQLVPTPHVWRGEERVALATAAADCDVVLDFPCGGRGNCGKCRVHAPTTHPARIDTTVLGVEQVRAGWRLGCRLELSSDTRVELSNVVSAGALKSFGPLAILPAQVLDRAEGFGFAVDIGTTTLAAALVDLRDGSVVRTISAANPQITYGADIMTRIAFARESVHGGAELHRRLVHALNSMCDDLLASTRIAREAVLRIVLVGNSTMMHTLAGADVSPLGEAPFEGSLHGAWSGPAAHIGLDLPHAAVWCPPIMRSHVGADLLASIIATNIDLDPDLTLLIDLGTNTEMVLASSKGLTVTSASGGPAFEASSIRCGMRAIPGAIDQLRIDANARIRVHTVAQGPPIGICGSGLLDAVAEMLRVGVVDMSGRMCSAQELPAENRALGRRLVQDIYGRALWIAGPQDDPVVVSAIDVRQLQLVKASISAAATLLLERSGHAWSDVDQVFVAGAFGNYINKTSAQMIGLLPDIDSERLRFVGHTAGIGARMMLLSDAVRARAIRIAEAADYIDLAGHHDYEERFIQALPFTTAVAAVA